MAIIRNSVFPESARHRLQLRTEPEGARVVLVEYERPRKGGDIVSESESGLLPVSEARSLFVRVRLLPLADVPEILRAAKPKAPPRERAEPGTTTRIPQVTLKADELAALAFLSEWMEQHGKDRAGRSGAVGLACKEAASARGWKPPEPVGRA